MQLLKEKLEALQVGKILINEPLKKHTTWKIGGPASIFIEPSSVEALQIAIEEIKKQEIPWFVIGRGSNLLVSDEGITGVVIKLGEDLAKFQQKDDRIKVGAGYSLIKLSTMMSKKGYSGLEFASGIPGSVGGAVFMNAGAHGSDISNILIKAHVLFSDGTFKWLENKEMDFSYRTSRLQSDEAICVEAEFQLKEGDKKEITAEMQKNKDYRRDTQPWNYPCCGSVFRNPLPHHAGKLIEEAGLKGYSIGGAQISEMHANFIVNKGDATANDVLELIQFAKNTIYNKFGVKMETEVELVGKR
ncbi:UDP-N-acetylmuramate dehydrogenase [Evansella cellulosilytica]|uniref:UDP-N-acetylenolpyruvoylglucosamine reductase n=1 Tax=Evansella cellulosilytica (strain ATCC 21833 / DSM 2522 / FERM P-1141 / JCM 9156 / N-4) TaxID=649639 RepID=E6TTS9_EVAC2|nr:UDP-N-acetylmuramate dehydrogenase [Evansella cellulosilytica]ADU30848.1 UDP-N-acetylenolpyruvoylglucosamine reductase [Evansella cellulosilytica DSM 2522]